MVGMLSWLPPAILTSAAGSVLLFSVFVYLYFTHGRERHVALWAGAWALSFVRYSLSLAGEVGWPGAPPAPLQAATYVATLGSTLLLISGTYVFIGGRTPRFWTAFTALEAAWVVVASALDLNFLALTVPVFWFLGAASVWTGVEFLRARGVTGVGHKVIGWVFVLWGLHRFDYPFVRPLPELAMWGFVLAGLLELTLTIGMLLVHMERTLLRLRESEERYRRLVEGSPDAILLLRDGAPDYANAPALRLLGDGPLAPGAQALVARLADAAREPEGRPALALRAELPGGPRDLEVRAMPLGAGAAQVVVQDVSERRRMEERLREAAKMEAVGRLAGGVAHDFNNLLTAVLGYATLLLLETADGDPRREYVVEIQRACERASELTRQLLAFARRQPLELHVVEVDEVIRGAALLIQRLLGERVRLVKTLEASGARVLVDPAQLELAIVNLAVNARDAMPDGGLLTIATRALEPDELPPAWPGERAAGGVAVAVRDTGVGMDEATRARLFEPFFTTKPRGKGTGLGLSTVHGIVGRGGGTLEVETAPGQGTTFTMVLPRSAAEATPERGEPHRALERASGTILVAEDEPAVRDMVTRVLEQVGYVVVPCASGEEALAAAADRLDDLDLLLSDLVMPGCSGVELMEQLRARRPDLRVLLMTGYAADVLGPSGAPPPRVPLLVKPFSADALTRRVREVLTNGEAVATA